jgi:outer membrane protein assembly factor BamB
MDKQEPTFIPELVDDQLDQLLAHRTPSTRNEQMVADLSQMYQDDEHSLRKVWQRLDLEYEQPASMEQQSEMLPASFAPSSSANARRPDRRYPPHQAQRRPFPRALSLLAAACVTGLLVASILVLSSLARQNQGSQVGTQPPLPPGVYTSDANHVVKISAQTHQPVWRQTLKAVTQILPAGNVVYVLQSCPTYTCVNGVVELDANSGNVLWTYRLPVPQLDGHDGDIATSNLVLAQGRLYIGQEVTEIIRNEAPIDAMNQIHVLNASDGSQQAAYPNISGESLVVYNDVLAVSHRSGLYAYDATNGRSLWHVPLPSFLSKPKSPPIGPVGELSIVNKQIYAVFSSNDGAVGQGQDIIMAYALNGEQVWQSPVFAGGTLSTYTVDQNVIYFGTRSFSTNRVFSGRVYAYDVRDKSLLWSWNSTLLWSKPVNGGAQEPFIVSNGIVYTVADGGISGPAHLLAFDTATGTLKWQYTLPGGFLSSFCINNGLIYINSANYGSANPGLPQIDVLNANSGNHLWEASQPGIDLIVPIE